LGATPLHETGAMHSSPTISASDDSGSQRFVTPLTTPLEQTPQVWARDHPQRDEDADRQSDGSLTPTVTKLELDGHEPAAGHADEVPTPTKVSAEESKHGVEAEAVATQLAVAAASAVPSEKDAASNETGRRVDEHPPSTADTHLAATTLSEKDPDATEVPSEQHSTVGDANEKTHEPTAAAHLSEKHHNTNLDTIERAGGGHADGDKAVDEQAKSGAIVSATTTPGDAEDEPEDESIYPGGAVLVLLTFGLCLTTFVVALDNTIIATAIPKITTVFDSLGDVGWYGSSYLLTTTSLQPTLGKVYTYFDVKWTYLGALIVFEIGSIICAAAQSSTMLILGRAIAGAGASGLFSGGMTIIGYSVAMRRRPIYIALLSSMFGISSVVGPLLGGVLTDRVSWRWCFWINLPFGGVALAVVLFFFKNPERKHVDLTLKQKIANMDLLGAFFLICGIVCLLLALQWGGTTYPWSDSKVWGCLVGFALIISIFIGLQFYLGERYCVFRFHRPRSIPS
jgi:hypothetical protein